MAVEGFPSIVLHDMQLDHLEKMASASQMVSVDHLLDNLPMTAERHNAVKFNRYIYMTRIL